VEIVDAQVHLWDDQSPTPLGGGTSGHLDGTVTADRMLGMMDAAGVDSAVLVPRSPTPAQKDYCLAAARAHPDRFGVMVRVGAEPKFSREDLRELRHEPGVLGIRLAFGQASARQQLDDHRLDWLWPAAEEADLPICVLPPGRLDVIAEIALRHPALKLVIDHLGLHTSLRDAEITPEVERVIELAVLPNVAVKASALPSYVTEPYPFASLRGVVESVVTAYGRERVFWGSDATRLRCTYREAVTHFTDVLDFLSADDLEWIMGRGLREWLDWPAQPR
jgi:L-fuconolactonase